MKRLLALLISILALCSARAGDLKSSIQQLQQALLAIDYFYVDTVDTDHLSETAIRAMLKELDPHSTYLNADEVKAMTEDLGGNFDGIGIRYQMERDTLLVISTVQDGPSERRGILSGDRIIMVDDTLIAGVGMSNKEVQRRLRGPRGTHVKVSVMRDGEAGLIDFDLERDKIPVYSVEASYIVEPGIGYIKVIRFAQTTADEFEDAIDRLTAQGMKHLIVDLQNNGGGYLQSSVELAGYFLPYGQEVVYTVGRMENRRDYKTDGRQKVQGRVVVLIDENSASASEILSGALQDHDRAVIVGRRSFGKGLVQRPLDLPGGAMIRLTTSHYYTPSGRCIQKPYAKGGADDYAKELSERFRHGELTSLDSIHFADSLRYKTIGGRTVYGGGGIMPDVFVPLDTTRITPTHRDLIARGTFNRFVVDYFKRNQGHLKKLYRRVEQYIDHFDVTPEMTDSLRARALRDSIAVDSAQWLKSLPLLRRQLKASLGSDLFEQGAYSRIMNAENPIFGHGLDIIRREEDYQSILHPL